MAKYEIQAADGSRYEIEVPDTPQPQAQAKAPSPQGVSGFQVPDWMKNIAGAATRGIAGLPALLGSGGSPNPNLSMEEAEQYRKDTNFQDPQKVLKDKTYEPKTDAEKYIASGVEGVTGGLLGPGSLAMRVGSGLASGLSGEVGARVAGEPGRLVGAVAGGMAPGMVPGIFKGNAGDLARRGLEGVSEAELAQAQRRMRDAAAAGTPITLGQALGRGTNIDSLETALANSEHGLATQELLRAQPGQLAEAGRKQVARLPGEVVQPNIASNQLQEGATDTIAQAKRFRTQSVDKFYQEGGQIPEGMVGAIQAIVRDKAKNHPNTALGAALEDLAEKLAIKADKPRTITSGSSGKRLVDPNGRPLKIQDPDTPITDLKQFNDVLKQTYNDLKAPGLNKAAVDAKTDAEMKRTLDAIREDLGKLFPKFAAGNKLYKDLSETIVDPLKKSTTGQLSGRVGSKDDVNAARTLADSMFKQGTTPGGKSNILTVERDLRNAGSKNPAIAESNKAAFLDAAKSHLQRTLGEIVQEGPGGQISPKFAENVQRVFGNAVQRQGLKDTLVGMARAQGLKDDELLNGFQNFLQIAALQAKRPSSVRGMNPQEIAQEAGSNVASNTARVASFMPAEKLARNIERRYEAKAMTGLDRMLTTPEGVAELQKLAKLPIMSKQAQAIVQGMIGGFNAVDNP